MDAFVIYNPSTGIISGAYTVANHDIAAVITANTPSGMAALQVDPSNPVFTNTAGWTVITTNGTPTLTAVVQTTAQQLTAAQSTQIALIQAAYRNATYGTPIAYMGTTFWTDQQSQNLLMGAMTAMTAAGGVPSGFAWWDTTGKAVSMTLAQLNGLGIAIAAMVNANFVKSKNLQAQIAAATTVAAVQAIVWN